MARLQGGFKDEPANLVNVPRHARSRRHTICNDFWVAVFRSKNICKCGEPVVRRSMRLDDCRRADSAQTEFMLVATGLFEIQASRIYDSLKQPRSNLPVSK
jgi:hypothetical protein